MTLAIALTLDDTAMTAEVPLGATLQQYFGAVEAGLAYPILTDGQRVLSPDSELAYRYQGAVLWSRVPAALLEETEVALVAELPIGV